jgi:dTDP-4-dehydrorhamnose reductase
MRLLVTGVSGLIGSNVAAAAAQQSWSVLGTWRETPVSLPGARTMQLDVADRHDCVALAEELEPDVIVHAGAESGLGRVQREPQLAELDVLGAENTLAAARAVRARYALVSCDLLFSGARPPGECWDEGDPAEPATALGRSLLAREQLVQRSSGSWLITRPADVYGVNLAIPVAAGVRYLPTHPPPADAAEAHARHVWERSGPPLRWVASLRAGRILVAPAGVRRSPTYAWDYAQRLCELIAQECEGVFNTAGPTSLARLSQMRLLARAFGCELELVREGPPAASLRAREGGAPSTPPATLRAGASGEGPPPTPLRAGESGPQGATASSPPLPANTALCDHKANFVLGHPAVDPFSGHRLMRRQLERLLGDVEPPAAPRSPAAAPPIALEVLG